MASGTDSANGTFPMPIREAIGFLASRYGLERTQATSAVYELLDAGVLDESGENMPFLETPAQLKVPLEQLDAFVQTLYQVRIEPPGAHGGPAVAPSPAAAPAQSTGSTGTPQTGAPGWQMVATLPHGIELPARAAVVRLSDAFANIIASAQHQLRISSPYIEWHGLNLLISSFEDAAARGVLMKLLVRIDDLENPDLRSIEAILALYELFGGKLEVRSYSKSTEQGGFSMSLGGVHSKILIADTTLLYAGSGEIRDHALSRNFELGFVSSDSSMAELVTQIFEAVWAISESIEAEYCRLSIG